ncbi:hypothetical protein B296_00011329 [Ensete ventricosum]|uniref:Uncharacterized protein n=1 Tax=Ensete ventricosum TaxID=4639 RepID=A0A426XIC9_ENSVE|nr:hypothetical protein B296_00011329 [Ensete ventricosum]
MLRNVCAQGRDGDSHATNDPGTLSQSRAGLPQAADHSHGGSSCAGKWPSRAAEAMQAATSRASGSSRMPTADGTQPCAGSRVGRVLAATQAATPF